MTIFMVFSGSKPIVPPVRLLCTERRVEPGIKELSPGYREAIRMLPAGFRIPDDLLRDSWYMSGDVPSVDPELGWEVADDICECARERLALGERFEDTDLGRIMVENMHRMSRITIFEPSDYADLTAWVLLRTGGDFMRHMQDAAENMKWFNFVFEPAI